MSFGQRRLSGNGFLISFSRFRVASLHEIDVTETKICAHFFRIIEGRKPKSIRGFLVTRRGRRARRLSLLQSALDPRISRSRKRSHRPGRVLLGTLLPWIRVFEAVLPRLARAALCEQVTRAQEQNQRDHYQRHS